MILFGKPVAEKIYEEIKKGEAKTSLAVILIGENPISLSYVKCKERIAEKLKIGFKLYHLPEVVRNDEVTKLILDLNKNDFVSGIVIQLPLPKKFEADKLLKMVAPEKDIDGFNTLPTGGFQAPTAKAILEIFRFYNIELAGKKIVLLGHGKLVGQPLVKIFREKKLKFVLCDEYTRNIKEKTKKADIIISATGVPGLLKANMVNKNAIVIDAGAAEITGHIQGDVSSEVYKKVSSYSPVPGGVGPVTVAMLMRNWAEASGRLVEQK